MLESTQKHEEKKLGFRVLQNWPVAPSGRTVASPLPGGPDTVVSPH